MQQLNFSLWQFILKLSRVEEISLHQREKPVVDRDVLENLVHCLLVCDETDFQDERVRVQLVLFALIMSFVGVRPGTIVEPQYHAGQMTGSSTEMSK